MEKKDYRPMWKDLGLNLEGHDQLLAVLGKAYKDIYLSQEKDRKQCSISTSLSPRLMDFGLKS